jgi:hypothetical protein
MKAPIAFENGHETASVWQQHFLFLVKSNIDFMHYSTDILLLSAILCILAHEQEKLDTTALGKSKNSFPWTTVLPCVLPCYKTSFIAWLIN